MEKILLFQAEQAYEIKKLASNKKIRVVEVPVEDYAKTIDELVNPVNVTEEKVYKGNPLKESMMVFCSVTEKHLDKLLFEMRTKEIKVSYKAMLTPHNANWDVVQLYEELERERQSYEKK